jgi:hypothetical protein
VAGHGARHYVSFLYVSFLAVRLMVLGDSYGPEVDIARGHRRAYIAKFGALTRATGMRLPPLFSVS